MSKEESAPAGGLLSKVVRFVRHPTVDWGELDAAPDDKESPYSKQMLKEMIERKRNNDFVRRREFDQLRKLRQREQHGQRIEDPAARPSFFQSSVIAPEERTEERADERAVTLKKIDEIEAQMSQQWWKSKHDPEDEPHSPQAYMPTVSADLEALRAGAARSSAGASRSPAGVTGAPRPPASAARPPTGHAGTSHRPEHHDGAAYLPTIPAGLIDLPEPKPAPEPLMFDGELDFGGPAAAAPRPAGRRPDKPSLPPPAATPPAPAPPAQEFVHDPDLEEAAIRFANGDHAGTETGLLEVLAQRQQDTPEQQLGIWMTLFDLYRAIGQHDRFDNLSIDFAARYSRSAPLWFSMPGQLGLVVEQPNAAAVAMRHDFHWNAPATLAVSSVAALHASLMRAASPWALSWARLTSIDEAAVPLLADHLGQWADREGQFVITGVEKLNALLRAKTPSGERSGNPEWWRLRMAALRLMGLADEFELVALEYCVTYEVSPPSWVAPRCAYSDNEGVTSGTPAQPADGTLQEALDMQAAGSACPAPAAQDGDNPPVARLSGHVDGDATHLLEPMQQFMRPGVPFTIACDKLIRMDFTAAGSVLNWAAEQQSGGHVVQFRDLQRLVAIFFNVIGIDAHAWVIPRKD
ncbi:hypothetical protein D5045_09690 [Verminephrobacter eiseniae]|uniref:STAS domain-containing protein n=1 Tax=Verminephrobacter eiseniae TaxID=364317 RepID=UPI002237AC5B|nr:STAS domain-containing protein [Verminephrobacter eiseniae]MCW5260486.1 hypothetical protein [Verminephrobacter eiseniae]